MSFGIGASDRDYVGSLNNTFIYINYITRHQRVIIEFAHVPLTGPVPSDSSSIIYRYLEQLL